MITKHFKLAVALALGALVIATSQAWGAEKGWMIGGGQGEADYHAGVADFDDGSIVSGGTDGHELGWKLFVGYRFNKFFAVEVGRVDLQNDFDTPTFEGISDGTGSFFNSLPDGPVSVNSSPKGVFAEVVGSLPLAKGVYLLGKVGVFDWVNEITVSDLSGQTNRRETDIDPVVGVGLEYRFEFGLAVRAEYEVFTGVSDEDIDLATAGISYSF